MVEHILSPLLLKERSVIYAETAEARQFDAFYSAMMICSCLLALLGLLMNSPAVIIGAMLISPLMGPVLACGLSLATAEWPMGRKAGRNVVLSILEVVVIAVIATRLSPLRDVTPEILARTNPNIMDLLVALFSGLAGTLAACSRRAGASVLPGVAVAVAVMPPLATTGYGLATSQWQIAGGAFMLFFTNLTAIILSAGLVFAVAGFRPVTEVAGEAHPWLVRYRIRVAVAVLAVLAIPLVRTLVHTVQQAQAHATAQHVLRDSLGRDGRHLDSVSVEMLRDRVRVEATIQTQSYIDPDRIHDVEAELATHMGRPVLLDVQQVQLARREKQPDYIASAVVQPTKVEPPPPAEEVSKVQQQFQAALSLSLGAVGIRDVNVRAVGKQSDGSFLVEFAAASPQLTHPDLWQLAAADLSHTAGAPVQLRGDVILPGEQLQLAFPSKASWLTWKDLQKLRSFATRHKTAGFQFVLVGDSAAEPELVNERVLRVQKLLPGPVISLTGLAAPKQPGLMVHVIQRVEGRVLPATAPPTTTKTAAAPAS